MVWGLIMDVEKGKQVFAKGGRRNEDPSIR